METFILSAADRSASKRTVSAGFSFVFALLETFFSLTFLANRSASLTERPSEIICFAIANGLSHVTKARACPAVSCPEINNS